MQALSWHIPVSSSWSPTFSPWLFLLLLLLWRNFFVTCFWIIRKSDCVLVWRRITPNPTRTVWEPEEETISQSQLWGTALPSGGPQWAQLQEEVTYRRPRAVDAQATISLALSGPLGEEASTNPLMVRGGDRYCCWKVGYNSWHSSIVL